MKLSSSSTCSCPLLRLLPQLLQDGLTLAKAAAQIAEGRAVLGQRGRHAVKRGDVTLEALWACQVADVVTYRLDALCSYNDLNEELSKLLQKICILLGAYMFNESLLRPCVVHGVQHRLAG